MIKRQILLLLCVVLSLTTAACTHKEHIKPKTTTKKKEAVVKPLHQRVQPLAEVISKAEGNYDSINRGWAGDTPGGASKHFGKHLTKHTIKQVIDLQRTSVYAVGRYQFIPSTLRFALSKSNINLSSLFCEETQDKLMVSILKHKRPLVYQYIKGEHDNINLAMDELAREWASIEYRNGRSYYSRGGNKAKISRQELKPVLESIRVS